MKTLALNIFSPLVSRGRYALLALILPFAVSCGGGSTESGGTGGSVVAEEKKLIKDVATIMKNGFLKLDGDMATLNDSVISYCDALGASEAESKRTAAQDSFKTAMKSLQHSLLHGVGPSLKQERMLQLYSWPTTSTCGIDLKLANNSLSLNTSVDKRGMDTLEYLLFVDPAANDSCPSDIVPVPADLLSTFNALSANKKQQRRCEFMTNVATDAAKSAKILADAWDPSKGNYAKTLEDTTNTSETLNKITDAMFYFEELVKENKLDAPLGGAVTNAISICGIGYLCPQGVESPYARISKENVRDNMVAFQTLYQAGFDDWLVRNNETALSSTFNNDIAAVITGIDGIQDSFYDAITNNTKSLNDLLLGPVQDVSKALRSDVIPALGLTLPQGSASDTD